MICPPLSNKLLGSIWGDFNIQYSVLSFLSYIQTFLMQFLHTPPLSVDDNQGPGGVIKEYIYSCLDLLSEQLKQAPNLFGVPFEVLYAKYKYKTYKNIE